MSSPSFLLAKESNPALLHILLESISNIIEHQYSHNPTLLYAIIRNHTKFQSLQHFDLHISLADLEERKKSKEEEKSHSPDSTIKPPDAPVEIVSPVTPATPFSVGDEEDEEEEEVHEAKPLSEKARGKLPEGFEIPRRESSFSMRSPSGMLSPSIERKDFHPTDSWVPTSWDLLMTGRNMASIPSSYVNNPSNKPTRTDNLNPPLLPPNPLNKTRPRTPPHCSNCRPRPHLPY